MKKIYTLKKRPIKNPLIIHYHSLKQLKKDVEFILVGDSFTHGACVNRPNDISGNIRLVCSGLTGMFLCNNLLPLQFSLINESFISIPSMLFS